MEVSRSNYLHYIDFFSISGLTLQVFPRPRRRPPLKSLSAIKYRPFNSASEDLESSPMLIMSPTSSSERNKQTMLISDLNNRKVNSEKCKLAEKASNVSAFEVGAVPEPQVTLGSEPTPSSWCSPLQLGNPRGNLNNLFRDDIISFQLIPDYMSNNQKCLL